MLQKSREGCVPCSTEFEDFVHYGRFYSDEDQTSSVIGRIKPCLRSAPDFDV